MLLRGVERGAVVVAEGDKEVAEVRVINMQLFSGAYPSDYVHCITYRNVNFKYR